MKGYQIRLLSYDQNLVNSKTLPVSKTPSCKKPDNSEEKCNLVVKGLYPSMTDKDLEEFFANKYGPV
jgi:RNA recognition motif-containing protein